MSFAAAFHGCIIPKAHPKQESDLLKPGRLGGGATDQGAANAVFSMREISPSGWIGQQGQGWRWICRGEAGASEMRPYQGGAEDLHPALSSPSATRFARGICRQRGGTRENEASRAGLRPDGVYVYAERSQGRANRPFLAGEHCCGEASRTLEGKPAQNRQC